MSTLKEMHDVIEALSLADGLMVSPGMLSILEGAFVGQQRPSPILHLDYQSFSRNVLPYTEGAAIEMAQIEDAIAAGVDAVMTYLYMGHKDPEREKMEIGRNCGGQKNDLYRIKNLNVEFSVKQIHSKSHQVYSARKSNPN